MQKRKISAGNLLPFIAVLVFGVFSVTAANAVTTMVTVSSAVYNSGGDDIGNAVAVDGSGNIIVTGISSSGTRANYMTIKYDNNLTVISSAAYDNGHGGSAQGVAADSSGNIIVTGIVSDGSKSNFHTIKYDKNMNSMRSKGYADGNNSSAFGVAVDGSDNIIVTGYVENGANDDYFTIKYDNDLNVISSATYNGGYNERAFEVAADGSGNIFVTGFARNSSGNADYFTIKYDSSLHVVSTARYDSGNNDLAIGVKVDDSGNVIVAGSVYNGTDNDYFTIKYDNNLNVISSATYSNGGNEFAQGVAVDGAGNVIVAGINYTSNNFLTVKYDSDLHVISTATYDGGGFDHACGAAVDASGNVFVTGRRDGSNSDFFTIKYRGSPAVTSLSPTGGAQKQTLGVAVTGANFGPGATVAFGGTGITVSTVTYNSATSLTAHITVSSSAATGKRSITVTDTNGDVVTKADAFAVLTDTSGISAAINPASSGQLKLYSASGVEITFSFPAGTFSSAVTVTAKAAAAPSSGNAYVKIGTICFEITNDLSLQPLKDVTVTLTYNDADIAGIDESQLALCRYDNGKWVEMPSLVDTVSNTIMATLNHFSTFALAQMIAVPDLSNVKVYPNPYNPKKDAQGLAIANLTADASLKIFNVAGELIAKPEYSGGGIARWYGKNDGGSSVASGVYLLLIDSPQGKKKMKIAVEK